MKDPQPRKEPAGKEPTKRPPPANPRIVESADLFGGKKLVVIHHQDEYYRLTVTRNGKLILQK